MIKIAMMIFITQYFQLTSLNFGRAIFDSTLVMFHHQLDLNSTSFKKLLSSKISRRLMWEIIREALASGACQLVGIGVLLWFVSHIATGAGSPLAFAAVLTTAGLGSVGLGISPSKLVDDFRNQLVWLGLSCITAAVGFGGFAIYYAPFTLMKSGEVGFNLYLALIVASMILAAVSSGIAASMLIRVLPSFVRRFASS